MPNRHRATDPAAPIVEIRQQRRKSLAMRVRADGRVVVAIPTWMKPGHPQVKRFIAEGLRQLAAQIPARPPEPLRDADAIRALVTHWAGVMGVEPRRVTLREMTRKWGSCSRGGNITLNTALYYVPDALAQYIVVHELAHLLHFDHSRAFWETVARYLPDYAERERELDGYHV